MRSFLTAPAARVGLPALLCLTSLAAGRAAAQSDHLTPPPARWALAMGLTEVGPGFSLARRVGDWPLSATVAGGPVGAGVSLQVHLPLLAPDDHPEGTVSYISGGAMRFLRIEDPATAPHAWTLLGGTRRWPPGPQGMFVDSGIGVWWLTDGSYAGNTGGITCRVLIGWAF